MPPASPETMSANGIHAPGETVDILTTPCLDTDYARLKAHLMEAAEAGWRLAVDFTNVHIVTLRATEVDFALATSRIDYFVPDSSVLSRCIKLCGGSMRERLYGPAFFQRFLDDAPSATRHFFLGASEEALRKLLGQVAFRRPDLTVAGSHHGYFNEEAEPGINEQINACRPDFIWVGLGTPRQQHWVHRNREHLRHGITLNVGFAFDVYAGTKTDAPAWVQRLGVTWLFRLLSEPRRLFWRYAKYNSLFLWHFTGQLLREHKKGRP